MYIKGLIVAPFQACEINPRTEVLVGCVRMCVLCSCMCFHTYVRLCM